MIGTAARAWHPRFGVGQSLALVSPQALASLASAATAASPDRSGRLRIVPDGTTLIVIAAAVFGPVNAYLVAPEMQPTSWGLLSNRMRFSVVVVVAASVSMLVGLVLSGRVLEAALLATSGAVSVLVAYYRRKQLAD